MFVTDCVSLCQLCGFLVFFIHPIHICAIFYLLWVSSSAELWANLRQISGNKIPKAQLSLYMMPFKPALSTPTALMGTWLGEAVCSLSGSLPLSYFNVSSCKCSQAVVGKDAGLRTCCLSLCSAWGGRWGASVCLYWGFTVELIIGLGQGLSSLLCWPILSTGGGLMLCFI